MPCDEWHWCGCATGLVVEGYTPEQVEEVRMVVRLLPVFFTTIMYWTVYAQMGTFFIMQARASCQLVVVSAVGHVGSVEPFCSSVSGPLLPGLLLLLHAWHQAPRW